MDKCDNCATGFDANQGGLMLVAKGRAVSAICDDCLEGARLAKLVVRRGDVGTFAYEQFQVIEMMRAFPSEHAGKGLSTPIGQPKR